MAPRLLVALAGILLAAAFPPRSGAGGSDAGSQVVKPSYDNLQSVSYQVQQAQQSKSSAAQALKYAQDRLNHAWGLFSNKSEKKEAADRALTKYQAAANALNAAEDKRLHAASEYVEKEEAYHAKTGEYYSPENYGYWKGILGSAGNSSASDQSSQPADLDSRLQAAQKDLANRPIQGIGDLMERSRKLSNLGDDVVIQKGKVLHDYMGGEQSPQVGPVQPLGGSAVWEPGSRTGGASREPAPAGGGGFSADMLSTKLLLSPKRDDMPGAPQADKNLSSAKGLLLKGDKEGALKALDAALASNPKDAQTWALKAQMLNKMHRYGEAEQAALKALQLDPGHADARKDLVWAQLNQKKYPEALANANELVRAYPEDPQGYLMRAFAYEGLGERAKMLADLETAASLDPRYRGHLALAKSGHRLFDPDAGGTDSLLEAIQVAPEGKPSPFLALGAVILAVSFGAWGLLWLRGAPASPVRAGAAAAEPADEKPMPPAKPKPTALAAGDVLGQKYQLARLEFEGPAFRVWSARDLSLERPVLIKELLDAAGDAARARAAHREEARLLAALHDPRIVDIYEFLDLPSGFFWVHELAPGKSLRRLLLSEKRLPWEAARRLALDAAGGLAAAHAKGIPHGNLRPENILVAENGPAKLMEFSPMPRHRSLKHPYVAPEAAGDAAPTPASDIYALGVCLYEALAGHVPDSRELPPGPLLQGLPPGADELLKAALEPDPARRLRSARELASRLESLG